MTEPTKRATRLAYAVFTPEPEGGFTVTFPEFPGCVTYGETYEEAKAMGQEVLELWLEDLEENGELELPSADHPLLVQLATSVPVTKQRRATPTR